MREIARESCLRELVASRQNGLVKVVVGMRRCGKSFLLKTQYRRYLVEHGVPEERILVMSLDTAEDAGFRDPLALASHVRNLVKGREEQFCLLADEIRLCGPVPNPWNGEGRAITVFDALNDLLGLPNLDVCVPGCGSQLLASKIPTEFRGRQEEIRLHPLGFAEYREAFDGDDRQAFEAYCRHGGMPRLLSLDSETEKMRYLEELLARACLEDAAGRKRRGSADVFEDVVDVLCSSVGSFTDPERIAATLEAKRHSGITAKTVGSCLSHLEEAFLFSACGRHDVKAGPSSGFPGKYFCEDMGLRHAGAGLGPQDMAPVLENVVHNELLARHCDVAVGIVHERARDRSGSFVRAERETGFVVRSCGRKAHIRTVPAPAGDADRRAVVRPFALTGDFFPKIVVRADTFGRWQDDRGILHIGLVDFLLDRDLL